MTECCTVIKRACVYEAKERPRIDLIPKHDIPFVIYKCVTCGPGVAASYHPSITPMLKHPRLVVSSYEPHEWRTCILLSPGASPDTWPSEFQFTGSPRMSVLDFVMSGVDGIAWTRQIIPVVFNLPLLMRAREYNFENKRNR